MINAQDLSLDLGLSINQIWRLARRGILNPKPEPRIGDGVTWNFDADEERAARVVVAFMRFAGYGPGHHGRAPGRNGLLTEIAHVARQPLADGYAPRWVVVTGDGSVVRGGDWLATSIVGPRTLVPLNA